MYDPKGISIFYFSCNAPQSYCLQAPRLAWLPDNNAYLTRKGYSGWEKGTLPYQRDGYVNRLDVVESVNRAIISLNEDNGVGGAPQFQLFGTRGSQHRFNEWREEDLGDKLHLSDKKMAVMGNNIVKYFSDKTISYHLLIN